MCELLVQAGRLDEASHLLDEADALVINTDEACVLAESIRIRGQIAAAGNDLTKAVRLFEKAMLFPSGRKRDYSSSAPQHN